MDIRPKSPASTPSAEQRLGAVLGGARLHVDVVVPRTDVKAKLRRLTRREEQEVSLELAAWHAEAVKKAGGPLPVARGEIGSHEHVLVLVRAVRAPDDTSKPLATLEEWLEADEDQLKGLMSVYFDIVARTAVEPAEASEVERLEIAAALKKKERRQLIEFGAERLADFLLTTGCLPST